MVAAFKPLGALLFVVLVCACVPLGMASPDVPVRSAHRRAITGELCAASSVRSGEAFAGCSMQASPDGSVGKEWCYLDDGRWGYCAPRVRYGDVRKRVEQTLHEKIAEMASLTKAVQSVSKALVAKKASC